MSIGLEAAEGADPVQEVRLEPVSILVCDLVIRLAGLSVISGVGEFWTRFAPAIIVGLKKAIRAVYTS